MKTDFKTEGSENLIFTINRLGLSTSLNVLDTTINMLYTDKERFYWYNKNKTFVISLLIPTHFDFKYDFSYSIDGSGALFAERVYNKDSLVFHRESNDIRQIDISFNVTSPAESELFTMKLENSESEVTVVLNDILRPLLRILKTSVEEGDNVIVTLRTPISWADDRRVPFIINGTNINSDDISCDDINYSKSDLSGCFIVKNARASLTFKINPNNTYSEGRETLNFSLSDDSYNDISASVFIIDTSIPVSCRWLITDLFNNEITQINEGESFTVTLITSGIAEGTDIRYTITGIIPEDLSGMDTSLDGIFNESSITRTFNMLNDSSTDGQKNMVFTTNFNDPAVILDVSANIFINDTSQSPIYQTSSNIANPKSGSIFRIVFSIINYPKLTETQKNEQLNYTVTVTDIGGVSVVPSQAIDGPVSGRIISSKGTLSSSGIMYHYFTYTCQTTDVNTFLFTIGNSSTTLTLNNI